MTTESRIKNGDVTLAVTRTGSGRKVVFFNGACSTQVIWKRVIARLKGQHEIITFDFRNHGKASASPNHSYEAFLTDAECVMAAVGSEKPIVVGWSLGADLAVSYAASHPGAVGGLVIIDGAVPIADKLVEDEPGMRRLLNSFSMKVSMFILGLTSWRYRLSGDDIADIVVDVDAHRARLPNLYAKIDCPAVMVLATKSAGENTTEHAQRNNKLWREGGERLLAMHPSAPLKWLDAGHRLPLTRPTELAETIDDFAKRLAKH
ncbi:MAG TPA: alpha/beta hydrolase [Hyphomonadaceae bacterium]|nr:alpha/beta hydrolase [Hyphomonadaceae bacterium]